MKRKRNYYYLIGISGLILNLGAYLVCSMTVDPYFGAIFTLFFPVWIIILVVGWRKEHPRR